MKNNNLKRFDDMKTHNIEQMKDLRYKTNCMVCVKSMNTNIDTDAYFSDSLNGWIHRTCQDKLDRCDSCDQISLHLESGSCRQCMRNTSVRSYGYKPMASFHRIKPKTGEPFRTDKPNSKHNIPINHFGVEIEVDCHQDEEEYDNSIILNGNNFASLVRQIGTAVKGCNLFYCKTDSSLSDVGIEVVSHPFSWNFWRTVGQDIYDSLFSVLMSSGYFSAETEEGGMHIHISKNSISRDTLLKLLWFIYESRSFMEFIAQRDVSSFASLTFRSLTGRPKEGLTFSKRRNIITKIAKDKHSYQQGRYTALNMQKDQTLEFRIFKGTLNIMTLSKAVEFIHSLLAYCSISPISEIVNNKNEAYRVDRYLNYLSMNQTKYTNLSAFIANSNYLSTIKANRLFREANEQCSRALMLQTVDERLTEKRNINGWNNDTKGVLV